MLILHRVCGPGDQRTRAEVFAPNAALTGEFLFEMK